MAAIKSNTIGSIKIDMITNMAFSETNLIWNASTQKQNLKQDNYYSYAAYLFS